ncbi:hypothetical protein CEXT_89561 [Caerostris extrusa]|uniref:Uncharacterized protein n=1 Tax=Caerostris extrusa TaxID=172846 RepID=A0AAV4MNP6_CAEEX|nr:hypothetical protein CEXT_89561 [Caerostris extrusa]
MRCYHIKRKISNSFLDSLTSLSEFSGIPLCWKNSRKTYLIFLLNFRFPPVLAAVYAYIAYEEEHVATIWLYGNVVNGKKYKAAVTFTSGYTYYVMYTELPIFITFSICTLLQRYGSFLLKYKKLLQITNFSAMSANLMKLIDEYNKIENNMCLLKHTYRDHCSSCC